MGNNIDLLVNERVTLEIVASGNMRYDRRRKGVFKDKKESYIFDDRNFGKYLFSDIQYAIYDFIEYVANYRDLMYDYLAVKAYIHKFEMNANEEQRPLEDWSFNIIESVDKKWKIKYRYVEMDADLFEKLFPDWYVLNEESKEYDGIPKMIFFLHNKKYEEEDYKEYSIIDNLDGQAFAEDVDSIVELYKYIRGEEI